MRQIGTLLSACLFLFIIDSDLKAQEQLGLRTDNYSGVNSLMHNPANFLGGAFRWDANVAGFGLFGENSYGYIHNTHLLEIAKLYPKVDGAFDYDNENQFPDNTLMTDFYDSNRKKYFFGMATVLGPSFAIKFENGQTFGIFSNFKAATSSHDIPSSFNFYFWDRTPFYQEIDLSPVKGAAMAWGEIGINYGRRFETYNGYIDLGASVKLLRGYEGMFFENKTRVNVTQLPNDSLTISAPNFIYGLTTTNASKDPEMKLNPNGVGMGVDLGFVYTIDGDYDIYQWKFGVGVLDIGKIHFNRNAQMHEIKTDQFFKIDKDEYTGSYTAEEAIKLLSYEALGDSTASLTNRAFSIWLPGAISLQADYAFTSNIFINGLIIQRINYKKAAVERGNFIALTPRFEHRWYGVSFPISFYNWEEFNFGASLRLGFITIGSENIGSYFKRSDFTGSDFYFAIKVNPFNISGGASKNRGKKTKCFYF